MWGAPLSVARSGTACSRGSGPSQPPRWRPGPGVGGELAPCRLARPRLAVTGSLRNVSPSRLTEGAVPCLEGRPAAEDTAGPAVVPRAVKGEHAPHLAGSAGGGALRLGLCWMSRSLLNEVREEGWWWPRPGGAWEELGQRRGWAGQWPPPAGVQALPPALGGRPCSCLRAAGGSSQCDRQGLGERTASEPGLWPGAGRA